MVLNAETGQRAIALETARAYSSASSTCAFSSDGKRFACTILSGNKISKVATWDMQTLAEKSTFGFDADKIFDIAFSPDDKSIVAVCCVGRGTIERNGVVAETAGKAQLKVLNAETGAVVFSFTLGSSSSFDDPEDIHAAFSPDGKLLVGSHHGRIWVWRTAAFSR